MLDRDGALGKGAGVGKPDDMTGTGHRRADIPVEHPGRVIQEATASGNHPKNRLFPKDCKEMLLPGLLESKSPAGNRAETLMGKSEDLASGTLPTILCPQRQASYYFEASVCPSAEWGENGFLIPASQGIISERRLIGCSWAYRLILQARQAMGEVGPL